MKQIISFVLVGILVLSGFGVGAFHEDYSFDSSISCFIDENDMVIIAPACFSDAIQPLVEHKNNHDVKTFLKTTEEIYDNYDCRDNPEKIKYFIKYAIEKYNISYVLLVGGFDSIPMRKSSIQWNYLGLNILNHIYTDTYYADIYDQNGSFSSWDSNDNGLYGEYSWVFETPDEFILEFIDSVDLYADVGVGRLPCSNYREVDVLVEKIISYETTTYGSDWFNRVLLLGGDTFPNEGEIEGEFITSYIETIMKEHSFDSVKLWASLDTFSPSLINKEWNKGAGFVSFSGHGNAIQMSTSTDNGNILRYFTPYQKGLNNKNEYPIVFLDACKTARLDISFLQRN